MQEIPGLGRSAGEGVGYPLRYPWASLLLSWYRICLYVEDLGSIPLLGTSPREGKSNPLQYFWPREFHGL